MKASEVLNTNASSKEENKFDVKNEV